MDIRETMFTAPEMSAVFSGPTLVQRMLHFEAALARAQARVGMIPPDAATAITAKCRVELIDVPALYREAAVAGTPAIPLVRMLTDLVEGEARKFVHLGATSQDAIDTAIVLQMRDGLDLLRDRLLTIGAACAVFAERHRHTPMAGRTLLQHAVPITFGLKAARWLALTTRVVERLRDLRDRALAVQLGGAAGTLAALGGEGIHLMELVAQDLGLRVPDLPWHTERDRIAEIAAGLGVLAGAMAKIASDVALLAQTEVGEVSASARTSTGRSSAMPQKRNPVEATATIACARLALGIVPMLLAAGALEHERGIGSWQAEWQAIPDLFRATSGAVMWVDRAMGTLEVDPDRMRVNLDLTRGLIMAEALTMALAPHFGRPEAYRITQEVCDRATQRKATLQDTAAADERVRTVLSGDQLKHALDVSAYLGSADVFIDRALAEFRALRSGIPTR